MRMLAAATADVVTLLGPPGTTLMKNVGCDSWTVTRTPVALDGIPPEQLPSDWLASLMYSHWIELIDPKFILFWLTTVLTSVWTTFDFSTAHAPA